MEYSYAYGINDAGQVVGYSDTAAGDDHAFITGPNGVGMTDLGTLGGATVSPLASTMPGRWWGDSATAAGDQHAFITGPNGVGMTDLGTLGGSTVLPLASTTPGRWWGSPPRPQVIRMLLSPAPMAWA